MAKKQTGMVGQERMCCAPRPPVSSLPMVNLFGHADAVSACASVFTAQNSTPCNHVLKLKDGSGENSALPEETRRGIAAAAPARSKTTLL